MYICINNFKMLYVCFLSLKVLKRERKEKINPVAFGNDDNGL